MAVTMPITKPCERTVSAIVRFAALLYTSKIDGAEASQERTAKLTVKRMS